MLARHAPPTQPAHTMFLAYSSRFILAHFFLKQLIFVLELGHAGAHPRSIFHDRNGTATRPCNVWRQSRFVIAGFCPGCVRVSPWAGIHRATPYVGTSVGSRGVSPSTGASWFLSVCDASVSALSLRVPGLRRRGPPYWLIQVRFDELPKDRPIVVVCHHGARSLRVALWLREQGFHRATSLAGGIDHWARQIDPSLALY